MNTDKHILTEGSQIKCRKTAHGIGGGMYEVSVEDRYCRACGPCVIGQVARWWNAETGARGTWFNSVQGKEVRFATKQEAVDALVALTTTTGQVPRDANLHPSVRELFRIG